MDDLGLLFLFPPHDGEMGLQAGTTSSVLCVAGGLTPGIMGARQTLYPLSCICNPESQLSAVSQQLPTGAWGRVKSNNACPGFALWLRHCKEVKTLFLMEQLLLLWGQS